jgi:DNA-binding NarL/FixJ family response regulator
VREGRARAVLIEGETGIGRSELLRALSAAARALGFTPYEAAAARLPVLVAVDDLHRADARSLAVLERLATARRPFPLAMAGTLRLGPERPWLRSFMAVAQRLDALVVRLGPLDGACVAALVAEVLGARAGESLLSHVAGAGGNPLYVRELVRALAAEGALRRGEDGGAVDLVSPVVPAGFRRLARLRIAALADETAEAVRLASMLGPSFAVADMAEAFGTPAVRLLRTLAPAVRDEILVESGELLAFRHELLRRAVYEDVPRSTRAALHLQAGRGLADAGAPAEQVAGHLALGGERGRRPERARRPGVGWDALTATEWRVVALAVRGLTNPEVGERLRISRRTVETHLSHIFTKLGVSSRVELAAVYGRERARPAAP